MGSNVSHEAQISGVESSEQDGQVEDLTDALATLMVSETPRVKEAKRQALVRDPRSPPLGDMDDRTPLNDTRHISTWQTPLRNGRHVDNDDDDEEQDELDGDNRQCVRYIDLADLVSPQEKSSRPVVHVTPPVADTSCTPAHQLANPRNQTTNDLMKAAMQTCRAVRLELTNGIENPETPDKCDGFDMTRRKLVDIIASPITVPHPSIKPDTQHIPSTPISSNSTRRVSFVEDPPLENVRPGQNIVVKEGGGDSTYAVVANVKEVEYLNKTVRKRPTKGVPLASADENALPVATPIQINKKQARIIPPSFSAPEYKPNALH